jgi:hypothetical protein
MALVSTMMTEREIKREPSTLRTQMLKKRYLDEKGTHNPEKG